MIDNNLYQQLTRVLSFPMLIKNNFLLKRIDPINGCIHLQSLAKENSIRSIVETPYGMSKLVHILIQYNYEKWIYDQDYSLITPTFSKLRQQVQVLIKKTKIDEFTNFIQELNKVFLWEPIQSDYLPNKEMVKLFFAFQSEEDAQSAFSEIQIRKANFEIQNAKMEEVDYMSHLLRIVEEKKRMFNEFRQQRRNYDDNNYQDVVAQRLQQLRSNEKIELNYAPSAQIPFEAVQYLQQFYETNNVEQNQEKQQEQDQGCQKQRRNNYDKRNYNRIEDDLREFTGYKKYKQYQPREFYEPKKES